MSLYVKNAETLSRHMIHLRNKPPQSNTAVYEDAYLSVTTWKTATKHGKGEEKRGKEQSGASVSRQRECVRHTYCTCMCACVCVFFWGLLNTRDNRYELRIGRQGGWEQCSIVFVCVCEVDPRVLKLVWWYYMFKTVIVIEGIGFWGTSQWGTYL